MALLGLGLICILLLVAWARLTDRPLEARPVEAAISQERVLQITSDLGGAAQVTDQEGAIVAQFATGEAVFISTVMRVLERERAKHGIASEAPVRLRKRGEARLTIFDPMTSREIELNSFGSDNVAAFAALLEMSAR
ncbi:MAG: photosynthetic complex assembly protein PuhC [Tateyamaria sp.]|jgi:putative photosynthetic complex assembly protein|uniref:photosynthetic complex assembly protein PuhC n=1 Tax=Tateyamaria sp. TaxID=1929288 RepID=UPI0032DCDFDE